MVSALRRRLAVTRGWRWKAGAAAAVIVILGAGAAAFSPWRSSPTSSAPAVAATTVPSTGRATPTPREALPGAGGGPSPTDRPSPATSSPSGRNRGGSASPSPETPADSVLRRRQMPPGGVDAVADFYAGGGDFSVCGEFYEGDVDHALVRVPGVRNRGDAPDAEAPGTVEIGELEGICPLGFRAGVPVRVTLTYPDGTMVSQTLCACGASAGPWDTYWPWVGLPGDPLGRYGVRAEQDSTAATGSFTMVRATSPVLAVRENHSMTRGWTLPRGAVVNIGVAGFAPETRVDLLLYYGRRWEDSSGAYIGAVPLRTDRLGGARYQLVTHEDDPVGCYALRSRPETDVNTREAFFVFCLE
jgi:hypothetical protein